MSRNDAARVQCALCPSSAAFGDEGAAIAAGWQHARVAVGKGTAEAVNVGVQDEWYCPRESSAAINARVTEYLQRGIERSTSEGTQRVGLKGAIEITMEGRVRE